MTVLDLPGRRLPERAEPQPPFRRELPLRPGNTFVRLLAAKTIASVTKEPPAAVVERMWPSDRIVARAASTPAMTTVAGWAAELAQTILHDALEALGPASTGAEVLKRGLVLNFDGAGIISAPGFVAEFGNAGWVAEGAPIPVRQLAATPSTLAPHKLAAIAVLTREMIESSNAEALIGDALMRAAGRMLDEVLFDANPGDAARPRGLRYNIAAITASNNADLMEAFNEDIVALINSLAPVAGNGPQIVVASPGRAAAMHLHFLQDVPSMTMFGSSAVVNDVLAIAPAALVAALSPDPEIETSKAATLVMDTAPGPAGTMGPERSLFQTDSIAIAMRWPVTWALRDPRGFAWLTPTWKS
jgi:hypothetical protein